MLALIGLMFLMVLFFITYFAFFVSSFLGWIMVINYIMIFCNIVYLWRHKTSRKMIHEVKDEFTE